MPVGIFSTATAAAHIYIPLIEIARKLVVDSHTKAHLVQNEKSPQNP